MQLRVPGCNTWALKSRKTIASKYSPICGYVWEAKGLAYIKRDISMLLNGLKGCNRPHR